MGSQNVVVEFVKDHATEILIVLGTVTTAYVGYKVYKHYETKKETPEELQLKAEMESKLLAIKTKRASDALALKQIQDAEDKAIAAEFEARKAGLKPVVATPAAQATAPQAAIAAPAQAVNA